MSRSSSNGDTPKRNEMQFPAFKRDPKTNWSWCNDKGLSNLNRDTGGTKSNKDNPKIDY